MPTLVFFCSFFHDILCDLKISALPVILNFFRYCVISYINYYKQILQFHISQTVLNEYRPLLNLNKYVSFSDFSIGGIILSPLSRVSPWVWEIIVITIKFIHVFRKIQIRINFHCKHSFGDRILSKETSNLFNDVKS